MSVTLIFQVLWGQDMKIYRWPQQQHQYCFAGIASDLEDFESGAAVNDGGSFKDEFKTGFN